MLRRTAVAGPVSFVLLLCRKPSQPSHLRVSGHRFSVRAGWVAFRNPAIRRKTQPRNPATWDMQRSAVGTA